MECVVEGPLGPLDQMKKDFLGLDEIVERRRMIRLQANCRFVDPDQFCVLAISSRRLSRADEPHAGLRGLRDLSTDEVFFAEEEKLHGVTARQPFRRT